MAAPEYPTVPSLSKIRVFLIGLLWAVVGALVPLGATVWDDWEHGEATDWHKVIRVSRSTALLAVAGYWRKHIAWLKTPPE